jgi:hypothetical protein
MRKGWRQVVMADTRVFEIMLLLHIFPCLLVRILKVRFKVEHWTDDGGGGGGGKEPEVANHNQVYRNKPKQTNDKSTNRKQTAPNRGSRRQEQLVGNPATRAPTTLNPTNKAKSLHSTLSPTSAEERHMACIST